MKAFVLFFNILLVLSVYAQDCSLKLNTIFKIGGSDGIVEAAGLYMPNMLRTDYNGNIFISDSKDVRIKMFASDGTFIKNIGSRGQGPGEISEVTCFCLGPHDSLVVVDRSNRRFTKYHTKSGEFNTYRFIDISCIDPFQIFPVVDSFLLYYKNVQDPERMEDAQILHRYNSTFSKIQDRIIYLKDIWDITEPLQQALSCLVVDKLFMLEDQLYLAPFVYDSKIYKIPLFVNNDMEIIHGQPSPKKPYKKISFKKYKSRERPMAAIFMNSSTGRHSIQYLRSSKGFFKYNDDLVFLSEELKKKKRFDQIFEVFDMDGVLKARGVYATINVEKNGEIKYGNVLWQDRHNRVYMKVMHNDVPAIHVIEMEFNCGN